jgi:decaprenylphospho-beta-D-ribofuranose 2-oxidase
VVRPRRAEEVAELLARTPAHEGGVIARGAGRSYGDAAQNAGGTVLDMSGLDAVVSLDPQRRLLRAQGGATISALLARLAPHRLTLPVLPGTGHVTLAGAIASDIHGKNHHRDGSIALHVRSLLLATAGLGEVEVTPDSDPELFAATLGGMGLTGVIVEATIALEPLPSPFVALDVDRTRSLQETLDLLAGEERHRFSVAWMDLLADGAAMGRAVVGRADPLPGAGEGGGGDAGAATGTAARRPRAGVPYPDALLRPPAWKVPAGWRRGVLHPAAVRAFNAAYWRAGPRRVRGRPTPLVPYFFPLDSVAGWNRLYGTGGLLQYQYVIPAARQQALLDTFALLRRRRLPIYLAVFKRFGPAAAGPLSFPLEGFTLALDVPAAAPGVGPALDELDALVAAGGGRVYLTKDARLKPEALAAMYPQLTRFAALRDRVDPERVLRSDLARRVGLCEAAG